jgi:transcription antitermination factor NusG
MDPKFKDPRWHVVYTKPKSERKVATSISNMGLESYLPLQKVIRQWSDRKKSIEMPLFPNYVFVKVDSETRVRLYSINELIRFVSIERRPVIVRENEIQTLKKVLNEGNEVSNEEYFQNGMKVRIKHGQFEGLEGVIIKKSSSTRILLRIDGLMKAYSFNIPTQLTERLS